jgi:predicted transcriptional regulator YdeE
VSEIVKFYTQKMPSMKLVGRKYKEKDKINGTFADTWLRWFSEGLFKPLEIGLDAGIEDNDAYIGLSDCTKTDYDYWIGVFLPMDAAVPEGYESLELRAGTLGVCWVKGKEPDVYFHCCLDTLKAEGWKWAEDENHRSVCFERYACPRFTEPDGNGDIILDQCYYIEK